MNQFKYNTSSSLCKHFSACERDEIEKSLNKGFSIRAIARALGRAPSSVSREIKRNSIRQKKTLKYKSKLYDDFVYISSYFSNTAQCIYKSRMGKRVGKFKISDPNILEFISNKILNHFSPAVVSKLLLSEFNISLSTKTIYNYIDKSVVKAKSIDLLRKVRFRKRKQKPSKQHKCPPGCSIELRPNSVSSREIFGHWEGDCIVGKQHKSAVLTVVERRSRIGFIFKLNKWNSKEVMRILVRLVKENPIFKSITFDNGREFARCSELKKYGVDIYYAHPYSSYERGSNENFNGMVRRFLPKGTDFTRVSEKRIKDIEQWINNYPRKSLDWHTAQEKYIQEISKFCLT